MKRIVFFIYQIFIWLPVFLVTTILTALTVTCGCFFGKSSFFSYYPGMIWSRIVCAISLCPVKIKGKGKLDKSKSYVFVANHQGAYDIFLIYGYLGQPIKWVMKKSLRKLPFVGKACESAGFIFVDNSSPQAAARTIEESENKLKDGASVVIFPEGSRTADGKLSIFRKGAFQMALNLKLPIVPVTINGSFDVMPIHTYLINPQQIELIIHDPIPTDKFVNDNLRETADNIRLLMNQSLNVIQSGLWDTYR